MKKIFKYFGLFLATVMMGTLTACTLDLDEGASDSVLGIKVFFPTKVVAGQPMTINGSGFLGAKEIVFPDNVVVTGFEIVSNDMIRVTAPSGIAAAGGTILVRTADGQAESPLPLSLGKTVVSGYSKMDGEEIQGGEQLTIYGQDLEFIKSIELLDPDGVAYLLDEKDFYRKGTSSVIVSIPRKNILDGAFAGKVFTYDGLQFAMPELTYKPAADEGHWETVKTPIWTNDGSAGAVSWNGTYRFAVEGAGTGEEIATIPADVWEKMKTTPFYVTVSGADPQIRVVTGWWNNQLPGGDIQPGNELLTDNGDGTWTLTVDMNGTDLANAIDVEHLLFTGDRYTVEDIYFAEETWVDGGGHMEIVKTPIWTGDGSAGAVSWNGTYRFAVEGAGTGEEIATIPADVWEKMKTTPFYVTISGADPQIRVVTGWWNNQWPDGDIQPGSELLTDNGDGTWTLKVDLNGSDLANAIDVEHLLFTGDRYTPTEIYFSEEVWVGGGGEPKEVVIWEGDAGPVSWNGTYRFAVETASTGEEITTIPADVWEKMKTTTFYVTIVGADPQIRVVTGWWNNQWPGSDIQPGSELLTDNGDGTWTLAVDLAGSDLANAMDVEHLLFTGDRYTPTKLYFLE